MKYAAIPAEVLVANKSQPMALINFLKSKRTVMRPKNPDEIAPKFDGDWKNSKITF